MLYSTDRGILIMLNKLWKIKKFQSLKLKTSYTINNLSNQITHRILCAYILSIIILSSLLSISN
jgi:hypothetical protein